MTLPVFLDFETRSCLDLKKHGGWAYAAHPTTEAVCCYLETPRGDKYFWTPLEWAGLEMPSGVQYEHGREFMQALFSDDVQIIAHNGDDFDRAIATQTLKLPPVQWFDTMALADYYGFPGGLDDLAGHLWGERKDLRGYKLMMKLCKPQSDGRYIEASLRDMHDLAVYNVRDVELMRRFCEEYGTTDASGKYIIPEPDAAVYLVHQQVNMGGVRVDLELAAASIRLVEGLAVKAEKDAVEATRVACRRAAAGEDVLWPPTIEPLNRGDLTRVAYLQSWINAWGEGLGWSIDGLDKEGTLEPMTTAPDDVVPPLLKQVINSRLVVSRAGTAKLVSAVNRVSPDGRLRGEYRMLGTGPGRFAGRGTQLQNLKRPAFWSGFLPNGTKAKTAEEKAQRVIDQGIALTLAGDVDRFVALVNSIREKDGSVPKPQPTPQELLGSMVRSTFIPDPGHVFIVADFSQIEARGCAWLANDSVALETFRRSDDGTGPDAYCAQATVTIGRIVTKDMTLERGVGKEQVLGSGYGMGPDRFGERCEAKGLDLKALGLTPEICIQSWRDRNRGIVRLWHEYDAAFRFQIENPGRRPITVGRCVIECANGVLRVTLPSGRFMRYFSPRVGPAAKPKWENHTEVTYSNYRKADGEGSIINLWSGKYLENICQATCRDLLTNVMVLAHEKQYRIAMHTHDEIILEVPEPQAKEAQAWLDAAMATAPAWADGFPIKGESQIMRRYGK